VKRLGKYAGHPTHDQPANIQRRSHLGIKMCSECSYGLPGTRGGLSPYFLNSCLLFSHPLQARCTQVQTDPTGSSLRGQIGQAGDGLMNRMRERYISPPPPSSGWNLEANSLLKNTKYECMLHISELAVSGTQMTDNLQKDAEGWSDSWPRFHHKGHRPSD
jgi:hypothetical protein